MKTVKKRNTMLPAKRSVVGWWSRCLWIFLGLSCLVVTVDAIVSNSDPCHQDFSDQNSVTLCSNASTVSPMKGDTQCTEASKGLVLMPLVLAPQQFYKDCSFFLGHLYNATCLGRRTQQEDEYNRVIFGILDAVSGQNRVPAQTQVEQFPVTVTKDGLETQGFSAFIIFKKLCRAADPERLDTINMCSNQTKNGTHLSLTLRGLADVPDTPSMCRCVIRPASELKLSALDVRLQNSSNRQCGHSALKIETNGSREDIRCHKMSALYGNKVLYNSNTPEEVTLTLTYISKGQIPTSLWISAQDKFQEYLERQMSISCGGFLPLPTQPPEVEKEEEGKDDGDGDGDENGEGDDEKQSEEDEAADAGTNTIIIVVAVVGAVLLIILIAVLVFVRRRGTGSYSGVMPACSRCCRQESDDDLIFYKAVTQQEPVYAEPGKPRPSATSLAYTYPADAKFPLGRSEYAEPDPNGTLGLAARATTPPPIPEVPPPGSTSMFPPGTPPPKPERTLLRHRKESAKGNVSEEEEEDYDHIIAGGKTPLKSPRGRDGQNNIIGDGEGEEGVNGNLYDCLQHGDDYSQIGEVPKQQVKDNVYDTTA